MPTASIADQIAAALEADILSGHYAPAQRLVEREIATRFGASSIPVREALQVLETRGLVVKHLNRGCSVVSLSEEEVTQMCELREWLEPQVATWAACRRTQAGLARLQKHLQELRRAAQARSYSRFFTADLAFHRCLWELAANPPAARALLTVVGCLFASGLRNAAADLQQEYSRHEKLFQAIADSRPADAALLLRDIASGFRRQLNAED
jgi:DNA-binding GntR family transcriptional regulator